MVLGTLVMAKDSAEVVVSRINHDYCEAYNAGNVDKLLNFFADDALTLSPGQDPIRGREAHRRDFEEAFRRETQRDLALSTLSAEESGGVLVAAGTWSNSVPAGDGTRQKASGYYLSVFHKINGQWRIAVSTFNLR